MRASTAFLLGMVCGRVLRDLAEAVAQSDTSLGEAVRQKLMARQPLERLLRFESEVSNEITKRLKEEVPA